MQNIREIIHDYAAAFWGRRWYVILVAWPICLAGWGFVIHMPDMYKAKARVYVDADSMLRPLLRGIAADTNEINEIQLMERTLLSGPNLTKVAHLADLDLKVKTPTDQEELVDALRESISISTDGRNMFSIAYTATDPQRAKKVVESVLDVFVESNLGNSRRDLITARNFIDEQIREYQRQLDGIEKRMSDFKSRNIGAIGGDQTFTGRLESSAADLQKAREELQDSREKQKELQHQLANVPEYIETASSDSLGPDLGPPGPGGPDSASAGPPGAAPIDPNTAAAQMKVKDLEAKISDLLLAYTNEHPDVVHMKRLLDQAKKNLKAAEEAAPKAPPQNDGLQGAAARTVKTTVPNPVYQQLKLQLVSLDTTIAGLEGRERRSSDEVKKWNQLAQSQPELNAQMVRLARDYEIIKRSYQELLNRREAAKIGQEMQSQTQTVSFRIIDPPELPHLPIGPNRELFMVIVLVAGLGAGGALVYVLAKTDETISNVSRLESAAPFPILGSVTLILSTDARRHALVGVVAFSMTIFGLLGAFGVSLMEQTQLKHIAQSVLKNTL
jgi:polysaccharide chain length determinant protein (PEP-CTERM system associated)